MMFLENDGGTYSISKARPRETRALIIFDKGDVGSRQLPILLTIQQHPDVDAGQANQECSSGNCAAISELSNF